MAKALFLIILVIAVLIGIGINNLLKVPPKPQLEDTWWGKEDRPDEEDKRVMKARININESVINDLKQRLNLTRQFIPPLDGVAHNYGLNTNLLNEIIEFWKNDYNWTERQRSFHKIVQYATKIQGLIVHYVHQKPKVAKSGVRVIPLLLLHGWPGSIREFFDLIPILITHRPGKDFVFQVIAPSLPGFGFSEGTTKPGLGAAQVAVMMKNLMLRLGFEKFYVQGGDWGAIIASHLATLYPEHVLGLHSNMCYALTPLTQLKVLLGSLYPRLVVDEKHEHLMYPLSEHYSNLMLETGYFHIQSTKPDTIGVALHDSPAGLAAYIIEKFITWTDKSLKDREDGGLKEKFDYAALLDNVMMYWVPGAITTSLRLYSETFNKEHMSLQLDRIPTEVPTACAKFKNELVYMPDALLMDKYPNLIQSTFYEEGGHFAAFEVPELLGNDIWAAVEKFEELHKNRANEQKDKDDTKTQTQISNKEKSTQTGEQGKNKAKEETQTSETKKKD